MRYDTILFDADGTLLDFIRSEREAFKETMAMHGVDVNEEMIERYSEINDSLWKKLEKKEIERSVLLYHRFELFCEHYGICANALKISDDYIKTIATKGYMLDGAEELLKRLYGKVRMYIITNGAEYVQKGRYAKLSLEGYFDGLFISEKIGFNKPDVRFFEAVEQSIENFDREKTLVVGDSLSSDIKGGIAFGLDTCWYNPEQKKAPTDIKPTFTAFDFETVYGIICKGES